MVFIFDTGRAGEQRENERLPRVALPLFFLSDKAVVINAMCGHWIEKFERLAKSYTLRSLKIAGARPATTSVAEVTGAFVCPRARTISLLIILYFFLVLIFISSLESNIYVYLESFAKVLFLSSIR